MDKSLNILQVLRAPVGGLFRHVCDLTQQLSERGHKVGLVVDELSFDAETDKKLDTIRAYVELGIHTVPIPRMLGFGDIVAPLRIRKLAITLNIDVLHGHGAKGGFHSRLAGIGLKETRKVYTPHGGVLHFAKGSASGLVFHNLERMLLKTTNNIVFESQFAAQSYKSQIVDAAEKAVVVHNGLLESEFEEIPTNSEYDFVFVGELRDLKGVETLLHALASIKTASEQPASLLIIGDGPHRDQFEALTVELGLTERVDFIGANPAKIGFAKSDIVVVPSYKESLPYIVMEAVAAGKDVIATDVGGIGEIFGPERDQLVPAKNVEALRDAMQSRLLEKPSFDEHNKRLQNHVKSAFSLTNMTDGILATYRK